MTPATAYIGLGSNVGDRTAAIRSAVAALDELQGAKVLSVSDSIETIPEGPTGQDRYLNAAVVLECRLSPRRLLEAMLAIEAAHGRDRSTGKRWGPRRLDLDLLMYDDRIIDEPGLAVPHPRMHLRSFVLAPLAQVAPRVVHPGLDLTIECLRDRLAALPTAEYQRGEPCWPG